MDRKTFRFTPEPTEDGMRLDQFVASRSDELSRSFLRKIVELGGAHVGGRRVRRCSHPVRRGEQVTVHVDGLPLVPYSVSDRDVLFRDRYLLVLNKPAGVDSQPTPARYRGTLYDALLRYLQDPMRPRAKPELGMVQRLDRDTSGVVAFSIHQKAHRELTRCFAERRAGKIYLALVDGVPQQKEGEIRSLLARNRATNLVRSVERGGREAITRYRVVEEFGSAALVEIELLTGRSHQIRAHFSESGHPLLGDRRYGGPAIWGESPVLRQMLHARRLVLPHPVNGEVRTFEAPLPPDMVNLLSTLRQRTDGFSVFRDPVPAKDSGTVTR